MSVKVASLIWDLRGMTPMQKLVLVKLADHASDNGENVFPRQKTVAADCECSVKTVQRVIAWAIEQGWLSEDVGPKNIARRYTFNIGAMRLGVAATGSPPEATHSPPEATGSPTINKNHQLTINKPSKEREGKPSEDECREYAVHLGLPVEEGSAMYHHFEMVGWVYGKSKHPVKNWKAALVTWKKNYKPNLKVENGGKFREPDQDGADFLSSWMPS